VRDFLSKQLRSHYFRPSFAGLFVNPFWIARRSLWNAIKAESYLLKGRLLDVGCGAKPYEQFFKVDSYIGLEYDNDSARNLGVADFFYDGLAFPFPNDQFDSILCNQVLEHVFEPNQFLSEIARVLKKDGMLLLTIPFVWDEHEKPHDYARYTTFGLSYLLNKHGFELQTQKKLCNDVTILFQLLIGIIFKWIPKNRLLQLAVTVFPISLISMMGYLLGKILPMTNDIYLDQLVVAKKL